MDSEPILCVFRLRHTDADQVFLVGTFNDWSTTATPMMRTESGRWEAALPLPPGEHRYCYVSIARPRPFGPRDRCLRIELVNRVSVLRVPESAAAPSWN